jgi:cleavage stimulation factor subunit 1
MFIICFPVHHPIFLTQVNYSPNGNLYVSASKDGDIKIWDGVSNRCINTFLKAHDGAEVCSATFSRNAKVSLWNKRSAFFWCSQCMLSWHNCTYLFNFLFQYILSSGKDSIVKLWELSTSRCLIAYTGAGTTGKQQHRAQAVFNHSEDYGTCFN